MCKEPEMRGNLEHPKDGKISIAAGAQSRRRRPKMKLDIGI